MFFYNYNRDGGREGGREGGRKGICGPAGREGGRDGSGGRGGADVLLYGVGRHIRKMPTQTPGMIPRARCSPSFSSL